MKVLLVHDYGRPTGGAELQMLALRRGLRERGHDARLFASRASLVPGEFLADYDCFGTTHRVQKLVQVANPSARRQLARVLREFQPDVVHARMCLYQLSPLILPLLRDVPSLYQEATYKSICPVGTKLLPDRTPCTVSPGAVCLGNGCLNPVSFPMAMMQLGLWRRWKDAFDLTVVLSESMRSRIEADAPGPVEVVHNGVPERPMRPPLSGPPVVAYAGRLAKEKGMYTLLQAMQGVAAAVPEATLEIAGDGPLRAELEAAADRLGLGGRVRWLGHLPRAAMEKRFEQVWVQVVPSLWEEPFGNVTTEAMMRGTAVVASAVGAQPEIVADGETGFLVPPGDADALANALLPLVRDRSLAERMGRAGRERAFSHFSEDRCVERFLEIYERLIQQRATRREVVAVAG